MSKLDIMSGNRATARPPLFDGTLEKLLFAAGLALGIIPLLIGCSSATLKFTPTPLVISPDAATGPDYRAEGSIDGAEDIDYFELVLANDFNTVVVMTTGATDTAGQVEDQDRIPITTECRGERHEAEAPCVWGADANIDTPNPDRSWKFNTMAASNNFLWEGSLSTGTYYIRVTGENGSTGPYELTVELANAQCPPTPDDPFGYYCR